MQNNNVFTSKKSNFADFLQSYKKYLIKRERKGYVFSLSVILLK